MKQTVAALLLVSLFSCQPQGESGQAVASKIMGGSATDKMPGVVALTDDSSQFCTGSLISKDIVITAGHCVYDDKHQLKDVSKMRIYVGAGHRGDEYVGQYLVEKIEVHPDYDDSLDTSESLFDFAYLVLKDSIVMDKDEYVALLDNQRLQNKTFDNDRVKEVVLMGFGISEYGYSGEKRYVETNMVDVLDYQFKNNSHEYVTKGSCYGDSGGPAFIVYNDKLYQIGVAQSGFVEKGGSYGGMVVIDYKMLGVTCLSLNTYGRIDTFLEWFETTSHGQEYFDSL